jgi:Uma2 family endonuclease
MPIGSPEGEMRMIAVLEPAPRSEKQEDLDNEHLNEIVDGQRVELPPMSILANRVASKIHALLGHHLVGNPVGEALADTMFHLPLPADRNRRPDVAFVSAKTIAEAPVQPGCDSAWDVLPELMVEVISPTDIAEGILEKVNEYFAAGTRLVWVVYPTLRLIYVHESPRQVRILGESDELDGGAVLPGFRIGIADLFPRQN